MAERWEFPEINVSDEDGQAGAQGVLSIVAEGGAGEVIYTPGQGGNAGAAAVSEGIRFPLSDVLKVVWSLFSTRGSARVSLKGGRVLRFEGFAARRSMRDDVFKAFSAAADSNVECTEEERCSRSVNFGQMELKGNAIVMERVQQSKGRHKKKKTARSSDDPDAPEEDGEDDEEERKSADSVRQTVFEVPTRHIQQCVIPGNTKNEVDIQFTESDTVAPGAAVAESALVNMRIWFPPDEQTRAKSLQERVMAVARVRSGAATGDRLFIMLDQTLGTFISPRGRFSVEFFGQTLRMHSNTYSFMIRYADINRLMLLARPGEAQHNLVISLDKPVRQGQQRYSSLVLQSTNNPVQLKMQVDQDTLNERCGSNSEGAPMLMVEQSGAASNVIAKIFKAMTGRKVFVPGKFRNSHGDKSIRCSVKANEGLLYALEQSLVFIHKPTILIHHSDIESVELDRSQSARTKRTDICVNLKRGEGKDRQHVFANVDKDDANRLATFLTKKRVRVTADETGDGAGSSIIERHLNEMRKVDEAADGDDDDDDGDGGGSSDDEDDDYKPPSESDDDTDSDDSGHDDSDASGGRAQRKRRRPTAGRAKSKGTAKKKRKGTKKRARRGSDSDSESESDSSDDDDSSSSDGGRGRGRGRGGKGKARATTKKRKKDPNAPKAAKTAFFVFSDEKRAEVRNANPSMPASEIAKELGQRWRSMSEADKEPYKLVAAENKKRYTREMEEYKRTGRVSGSANGSASSRSGSTAAAAAAAGSDSDSDRETGFGNSKSAAAKPAASAAGAGAAYPDSAEDSDDY